jgi:FAD:protein FMN transferase
MELNLGSIDKGFAVQAIADRLAVLGCDEALVSAGSSSAVALGAREYPVDVWSRAAGRRVVRVRLRRGALATSGAGEQFVEIDGTRFGHVIDPRSGTPARGVLSVSVIAADGAIADALATAFFVGGADLARRYCETHSETLAFITPDDDVGRTEIIGHSSAAVLEDV